MPTTGQASATWNVSDHNLLLSARFDISILVWKTDNGFGVAHINILRVWPQRIESDPKRLFEIARIDLIHLGLTSVLSLSENSYQVCLALSHKKIAIRGSADQARIFQARGKFLGLESFWYYWHRPFRPFDQFWSVVYGRRFEWFWQISGCYMPTNAGCVGAPVAHRPLSG